MDIVFRPIRREDRRTARALLESEFSGSPYLETPLWALDQSLGGDTPEARALVAEWHSEVIGVALYGHYAGARGAGRAYLVVVTAEARLKGVALGLMDAVHSALEASGARFVLAEVPDDAVGRPARELLDRCGYIEEARIPDLYRPGVSLLFLRRELLS